MILLVSLATATSLVKQKGSAYESERQRERQRKRMREILCCNAKPSQNGTMSQSERERERDHCHVFKLCQSASFPAAFVQNKRLCFSFRVSVAIMAKRSASAVCDDTEQASLAGLAVGAQAVREPSRGFKKLKREVDAESASSRPSKVQRIVRYGCLLPSYYPVLEALPTAALPWKPPTGRHSYQVKHSWIVPVIVNLKDEKFIVQCGRRSQSFLFGVHNGVQAAWERAFCIAEEWKDAPPDQPEDGAEPAWGA